MAIKNIMVLGNDKRQNAVKQALLDFGFCITDKICIADAIIAPIPLTLDNKTINISYEKIFIDELFKLMKKDAYFFCASPLPDSICKLYSNIKLINYFDDEALSILNAVATVEGALATAILNTDFTLHSSLCLVTGFGRIGKLLAKSLHSLGANTFVFARKQSDLSWINAYGYNPVENIADILNKCNIIFNTVPSEIINKNILDKINSNTLIVDLASHPGGVDKEYAKKKNISVIHALALPAKSAPITSGKAIAKTIIKIIKNMEAENANQ